MYVLMCVCVYMVCTYTHTHESAFSTEWRHSSVTSIYAYIVKEFSSLITGKIKPFKSLCLNTLCILL